MLSLRRPVVCESTVPQGRGGSGCCVSRHPYRASEPYVDEADVDLNPVIGSSHLALRSVPWFSKRAPFGRFSNSGRSFHAYSLRLISPKEWREFMGRLLLLNLPGRSSFIDSRWVGHRLVAGYASLRWTANSEQYTCQLHKFSICIGVPATIHKVFRTMGRVGQVHRL